MLNHSHDKSSYLVPSGTERKFLMDVEISFKADAGMIIEMEILQFSLYHLDWLALL